MSASGSSSGLPLGGGAIPAGALKACLPAALDGWTLADTDVSLPGPTGLESGVASASYRDGTRQLTLRLVDLGGFAALADRSLREITEPGSRHIGLSMTLANGVAVELDSDSADLATLRRVFAALPLDRIEALQRPAG